MAKQKRFDSELKRAIADAYRNGVKVRDIMAEYDLSTATLYDVLTREGVKIDRVRRGKPRKTPMVSPYLQRACDEMRIGYVDIAEKISYSHEYTYVVLTGYKPMTPYFARAIGDNMRLDGNRIYQEAVEWWKTHRGGNEHGA